MSARGIPKGLPLVIGVGGALLVLAAASPARAEPPPAAPPPTPPPPTPPPGPLPPGPPPPLPSPEEPPPMFGDYVTLGDAPSVEREGRILQAVLHGLAEPISWVPIEVEHQNHQGTIYVSADALKLPLAATLPGGQPWTGVARVNVTHPSATIIGDFLGAYVPTSKISDLAYQHAKWKIRPQTQTPDDRMMQTSRMVQHSLAIDRHASGAPSELLRTVGKDYVASPKNDAAHATIFGWHDDGGGFTSPGGARVLQPVSNAHLASYRDYSHFPTFVRRMMDLDGKQVDVADVARDPELYPLVSDEGQIPSMRHPSLEG